MTRAMAVRGVWTPWATVWCLACDQQNAPPEAFEQYRRERVADPQRVVEQPDGDDLGTCDCCSVPCWVRSDVARLQAIVAEIFESPVEGAESQLQQTGGMCAALVVKRPGETRQIVVSALDGPIVVGEYTDEEWNDSTRDAEFGEDDVEAAALCVIEWVDGPAVTS